MSQADFNSMIRRRNLADLTKDLVELGRVIVPGTLTVPSNTAPLLKEHQHVANTPEPLVADGDGVARPCSSVYSRDIDGNSPSFTALVDRNCSSHTTCQSQSPIVWPFLSRRNSIRASFSSLSPAITSSRATSFDFHCSGTAAPKADYWPLQPHPSDKTLRMSITEPRSLPSSPQNAPSRAASLATYCSGTAAPKAKYCPLETDRFSLKSRMSDARPQSLPATASVNGKVRVPDSMSRG